MSTELEIDVDSSIEHEFTTMADEAGVTRTAAALEADGMRVLRAAAAAEAKRAPSDREPGPHDPGR